MVGARSTLQPASVVGPGGTAEHAPLSVGSFVHIGSNVSVAALGIGSHVVVGDGAVIENAVDVKSCVLITSGSVVKEATVCPSHTGTSAPMFHKQPHSSAPQFGMVFPHLASVLCILPLKYLLIRKLNGLLKPPCTQQISHQQIGLHNNQSSQSLQLSSQ